MNKSKRYLLAQCWMVLCGLLLVSAATQANAQMSAPHAMSGQHPNYLHAIRDLREARGILTIHYTEPAHLKAAQEAIHEVDRAIDDLKNASKLDDKNLGDVPPPATMPEAVRFQKALDLFGAAHHEIDGTESDPAAVNFRDHAKGHIDAAGGIIRKAI